MDETYIKVKGEWVYLYRAVDTNGDTIDFLLRKHRDAAAAKAFFKKAFKNNGRPAKVNIDKSGSNISALNAANADLQEDQKIEVRQIKYLNNMIEQDHRFIKKRTRECHIKHTRQVKEVRVSRFLNNQRNGPKDSQISLIV
jgi:putative transposase